MFLTEEKMPGGALMHWNTCNWCHKRSWSPPTQFEYVKAAIKLATYTKIEGRAVSEWLHCVWWNVAVWQILSTECQLETCRHIRPLVVWKARVENKEKHCAEHSLMEKKMKKMNSNKNGMNENGKNGIWKGSVHVLEGGLCHQWLQTTAEMYQYTWKISGLFIIRVANLSCDLVTVKQQPVLPQH